MAMEDIIGSAFILIIIILLLIWLLNIIYKTYIVKAKLIKTTTSCGTHNYNDGDSSIHITYYYSFKTKKGKEENKTFSGYSFIKKGQSRLIFYSEDKNELVGKIRTPFILSVIIVFLFLGIANIGLEICIIASIVLILTIIIFIMNYKRKYSRGEKNEHI